MVSEAVGDRCTPHTHFSWFALIALALVAPVAVGIAGWRTNVPADHTIPAAVCALVLALMAVFAGALMGGTGPGCWQ